MEWTDEGVILDLSTDRVAWADGNAWAPAIVEKVTGESYKYFFYFSGNPVSGGGKQIGVAVAANPTGPFKDSGKPLITSSPAGGGQQIDPCVFPTPYRERATSTGATATWPSQSSTTIWFP